MATDGGLNGVKQAPAFPRRWVQASSPGRTVARAMRHGYLLASSVWVAALALGLVAPGVDAAQFFAHRWPDPYTVTDYASGAGFYYSPPVALLFAPLTSFGLPVFAAMLTGAGLLALYAILGQWAWLGLFFPPVWWDLTGGNVNTLIGWAALTSASSASWASIPLLTKVTPGVVVGWHAARGDIRRTANGLLVPAALCLASAIVNPDLWMQWVRSLTSNSLGYAGPGFFTIPIPLLPRVLVAGVVLLWGARTSRLWTVPIVVTLAMPVLWYSALAPLVALARSDVWKARSDHESPFRPSATSDGSAASSAGRDREPQRPRPLGRPRSRLVVLNDRQPTAVI